jgi:excisionase family DNA binding protein
LTAREVADLIGMSNETVLRWVRQDKLPAIRLPGGAIRFREDDIEAKLAEWATPGRGVSPAPMDAARPVPYDPSPVPEVEE